MSIENSIQSLHASLAHAVYQGFPEFEYQDRDWDHYRKTKENSYVTKSRKHSEYDVAVYSMFPQTWSSTSLGFGGIGGQAFTPAYTVILESHQGAGYCVYFGGRFAYRIARPNRKFFEDIAARYMSEVSGATSKYEHRDEVVDRGTTTV